jgi:hypothetical protein
MPHPCPHHCPSGSGGGAAVLVVLAVIVIAAAARPVVHAAELAAEVALIIAASIAGLAVTAAMAWAAWRVYRWQANRARAIQSYRLAAVSAQSRTAPRHLEEKGGVVEIAAIEAPKPRLADYETGQRAADYESR